MQKGIPFSQAKRYRRIISSDETFEKELDKLKSYFLERNYPTHVVDDAFQKAYSLSRDMALKETTKSNNKLVPYVITYNPSLPNIGEIINKYWGLLALSQNPSVKYVFQHKPVLAFKRPQNLGDTLIHSKMNFSQNSARSVSSYKRRRCTHCKSINESTAFKSSSTSEVFSLKKDFESTTENVIYLITCKRCNSQHVGQTHQKVSKRMDSHRFDIFHHPDSFKNVSVCTFQWKRSYSKWFLICPHWKIGCSMATIIKRNILDASPEYHFPKWNEFQGIVPNSKRVTNFLLL